jgi:hypothetical protein
MTTLSASIKNKRRNQNQKFSFPFFAGSPHTPRRKRNCKEIFGFGIATEGSERGASIIRQNPADFARNTFELRPIHTAREFRTKQLNVSCFLFDRINGYIEINSLQ